MVAISLAIASLFMALHLTIDHDYGRGNGFVPVLLSIGALVLMIGAYIGSMP